MTSEDATLARRLVESARSAMLATLAARAAGTYPFGSLVDTATDGSGRPLLLLSSLAEHTKNLAADPRASLLFAEQDGENPLASPRVTLLGEVHRVGEGELDAARDAYLARHPEAAKWASFKDFAFYRLGVEEIRLVVGFGKMGWIEPGTYAGANVRFTEVQRR